MKKLLVVLLAVLMVTLSITAFAEVYVKVNTGNSTNYRDEPSLDGNKLGAFTSGTTVTFAYEDSVDDRGVEWYLVELEDGTEAWVSSKFTYLTDGTTDGLDFEPGNASVIMEVTEDDTLAGSPFKGVGDTDVLAGDKVTDTGCTITVDDGTVYAYVITEDGNEGWIHDEYLTAAEDDSDADDGEDTAE